MIDTTDLKLMSRLSPHVNAGCGARLSGLSRECHSTDPEQRAAWLHGWDTTDAAEIKAGRPVASTPEFIRWSDDGTEVRGLLPMPTVNLEATMEFRDGPGLVKLMEQAIGEARPIDQEGFRAIHDRLRADRVHAEKVDAEYMASRYPGATPANSGLIGARRGE